MIQSIGMFSNSYEIRGKNLVIKRNHFKASDAQDFLDGITEIC